MDINPEDIDNLVGFESRAAAAALYGSRAADGVVIITTKKGAEGTAKIGIASKIRSSCRRHKLPQVQNKLNLEHGRLYASNGVFSNITYNSWDQWTAIPAK